MAALCVALAKYYCMSEGHFGKDDSGLCTYRCTGVQMYKYTSVHVYKCACVQMYRCTGIQDSEPRGRLHGLYPSIFGKGVVEWGLNN